MIKTLFPTQNTVTEMLIPLKALPSPKIRVDICVNIDHSGSVQLTVPTNSNTESRITLMSRRGLHFSLYTSIDVYYTFNVIDLSRCPFSDNSASLSPTTKGTASNQFETVAMKGACGHI